MEPSEGARRRPGILALRPGARIFGMARGGRVIVGGVGMARYPLAHAARALEDLASRRNDPVRLVLLPGASS